MSNHLAIATVTGTLQHVLAGAASAVPGAVVSTKRPDGDGPAAQAAAINVFLYQVVPNPAYRNADLPTRSSNGQLMHRPQAAFTLHYLLTFFGDDTKLEPQRLLGATVRKLHSEPLLRKADIQSVTQSNPILSTSNLDAQVDLVRFTPLGLSLEEMSKVWSVFFQSPYALSVAYQASAILIETDDGPRRPLPVLTRNVYVRPFRQPVVEKVVAEGEDEAAPIVDGANMVIKGRQLRGDTTLVVLAGMERIPLSVADTEIVLPVPLGLHAGVHALQVQQKITMGAGMGTPHRGFESNVTAFVLSPTTTQAVSNITSIVEQGVTLFSARITVNFTPPVGKTQFVKLLLNEFGAPTTRPAHDYSFTAPKDNGIVNANQIETTTVVFAVSRVRGGTYFLRVQVDGAESPLAVDKNEASPTFNQYIGPKVTIQ
jgi:hypothetical protein